MSINFCWSDQTTNGKNSFWPKLFPKKLTGFLMNPFVSESGIPWENICKSSSNNYLFWVAFGLLYWAVSDIWWYFNTPAQNRGSLCASRSVILGSNLGTHKTFCQISSAVPLDKVLLRKWTAPHRTPKVKIPEIKQESTSTIDNMIK